MELLGADISLQTVIIIVLFLVVLVVGILFSIGQFDLVKTFFSFVSGAMGSLFK